MVVGPTLQTSKVKLRFHMAAGSNQLFLAVLAPGRTVPFSGGLEAPSMSLLTQPSRLSKYRTDGLTTFCHLQRRQWRSPRACVPVSGVRGLPLTWFHRGANVPGAKHAVKSH